MLTESEEGKIRSDDRTLIAWWKRLLYQERKRHGQVETILTRQITHLERQVDDLRKLYFGTISVPTSPNTKQTSIHKLSNEPNKKGNILLFEDISKFTATARERANARLKAERETGDVRPETLQEIANYRPPLPSVKLPYQDDENPAHAIRPQVPRLEPSPIDCAINNAMWAREAGRINEHTTDPDKLKRMRALLPRLAPKRAVSCGSADEVQRFPGWENPY